MKTVITICICCSLFIREPVTCQCQDEVITWTAYCPWLETCNECCKLTKPKK